MKQLGKPYSILSYFLALIGGFFIGLAIAAFTEAGKDQMLAGGAIVFFYAIIGSAIALILAFILALRASRNVIIGMNIFYTVAILASFLYLRSKKQKRDLERQQKQEQIDQQNKPSQTTSPENGIALLTDYALDESDEKEISAPQVSPTGLGMFTPNFYKNSTLYFYGNLTEGKSIQEHTPIDSVTFKQREIGGFDIATAPPWFIPDHLKLDYDILYFKVQSLHHDFIEVTVNTTNNKTAFVDRFAGKLMYWPEFFMNVNSVEFPDSKNHHIYERPFDTAGKQNLVNYSFMRPKRIKNEWMYVDLLSDGFETVGSGWIRWMKNGQLLISYNLLS